MHRILWGIWRETNLRLFEDKARSSREVIDSIVRDVDGLVLLEKEFQGTSLSLFLCD